MATNTYVALDKVTVGTATPSITFTSIPSTYTDLVIVANCGSASGQAFLMRFNGDTGSNYSETALLGNGSSASSYRDANTTFAEIGGIWNSQGISIINIMNYSNTTTYKTALTRNNDASQRAQATVNLWRNTAAITSVTLFPNSSVNFNVGSTFSLYGIAAASVGALATGGTIFSDDNYYWHVFGSSGTFTPLQNLTNVDYLVVAGGGGAQSPNCGGGGGAGGYRTTVGTSGGGAAAESQISLTGSTAYTVTIGAGGYSQSNGSNSSIAGTGLTTITSLGGGAGTSGVGSSGGSGGGGAAYNNDPTYAGGAGTTGQGYAGSTGLTDRYSGAVWRVAGSGGGAGGTTAAVNSSSASPTNSSYGGPGLISPIDGNAYAGGGGGGSQYGDTTTTTGGIGGGGTGGGYFLIPTNGRPNTGGGAGGTGAGGAADGYASSGGSGVVIIRYPKA